MLVRTNSSTCACMLGVLQGGRRAATPGWDGAAGHSGGGVHGPCKATPLPCSSRRRDKRSTAPPTPVGHPCTRAAMLAPGDQCGGAGHALRSHRQHAPVVQAERRVRSQRCGNIKATGHFWAVGLLHTISPSHTEGIS